MNRLPSELYHIALMKVDELLPQVNYSTPANDPKMVELCHFSDIVEEYETRNHSVKRPTASNDDAAAMPFAKSAKFAEAWKDGDVK